MDDIRAIRTQLGLTQIEFADRLGLHQSTISRLETGEMEIDKRTRLAVRALQAELGSGPQSGCAICGEADCGHSEPEIAGVVPAVHASADHVVKDTCDPADPSTGPAEQLSGQERAA